MKTGLAWLAVSLTGVALTGPAQALVTRVPACPGGEAGTAADQGLS